MTSPIAKKLLRWYSSRKRELPWREQAEPYAVWVGEIMAQQTRMETLLPYYQRWMRRFPNVASLARSRERDVLLAWEGLGYYSRARNLRKAAKVVIAQFGGELPADVASLGALPGIGPYTAGAIASLAFRRDVPAVDGNAIRVLARVFNVKQPADTNAGKQRFWQLAAEHLPPDRAANYNQALMDLGAELCTPRRPRCEECPLAKECKANALGIQEERPVKSAEKQSPVREFAGAVIRQGGEVLVVQRPSNGLLGGMWEFPNARITSPKRAKEMLRRALRTEYDFDFPLGDRVGSYDHAYSHFQARLHVYNCPLNGKRPKTLHKRSELWLKPSQLSRLPMGKLDRQIANVLLDGAKQK